MVLYISTNHKYVGTLHLFLFFPCCVVTTLCSWSGWVQAQKTLRSGQHVLVYWDWWPPGMLLWWRKYQCPSNGQNMDMTQLSNFLISKLFNPPFLTWFPSPEPHHKMLSYQNHPLVHAHKSRNTIMSARHPSRKLTHMQSECDTTWVNINITCMDHTVWRYPLFAEM